MNISNLNRVQCILADIFEIPVEQVKPGSSPDTIESWDSLKHVNLVLAIEKEFGVHLSPEEIEQLLSVESIAELLDGKL